MPASRPPVAATATTTATITRATFTVFSDRLRKGIRVTAAPTGATTATRTGRRAGQLGVMVDARSGRAGAPPSPLSALLLNEVDEHVVAERLRGGEERPAPIQASQL